jgi:hypothetical protein
MIIAVVYIQFFSLLDALKPFLIIIINYIILSDATIRVPIFQRFLRKLKIVCLR